MEKVLKTLRSMGFKLKKEEGLGYSFIYEVMNMMCLDPANDEHYLCIAVTGLMNKEEATTEEYLELFEYVNINMKYVKPITYKGELWLIYERELLSDEDLETVIQHMILCLEFSVNKLVRKYNTEEEEAEETFDFIGAMNINFEPDYNSLLSSTNEDDNEESGKEEEA